MPDLFLLTFYGSKFRDWPPRIKTFLDYVDFRVVSTARNSFSRFLTNADHPPTFSLAVDNVVSFCNHHALLSSASVMHFTLSLADCYLDFCSF